VTLTYDLLFYNVYRMWNNWHSTNLVLPPSLNFAPSGPMFRGYGLFVIMMWRCDLNHNLETDRPVTCDMGKVRVNFGHLELLLLELRSSTG